MRHRDGGTRGSSRPAAENFACGNSPCGVVFASVGPARQGGSSPFRPERARKVGAAEAEPR